MMLNLFAGARNDKKTAGRQSEKKDAGIMPYR
jgi:hypothetical protein